VKGAQWFAGLKPLTPVWAGIARVVKPAVVVVWLIYNHHHPPPRAGRVLSGLESRKPLQTTQTTHGGGQ
jgi:hypothetical protein